jgi:hypothetical protein
MTDWRPAGFSDYGWAQRVLGTGVYVGFYFGTATPGSTRFPYGYTTLPYLPV